MNGLKKGIGKLTANVARKFGRASQFDEREHHNSQLIWMMDRSLNWKFNANCDNNIMLLLLLYNIKSTEM